jgi:hypothetical protein
MREENEKADAKAEKYGFAQKQIIEQDKKDRINIKRK